MQGSIRRVGTPVEDYVEGKCLFGFIGDEEAFAVGATSQLMGPVRIPVSTIRVLNSGCGVPGRKVPLVLTGTAVMVQSGEI